LISIGFSGALTCTHPAVESRPPARRRKEARLIAPCVAKRRSLVNIDAVIA
jgi:hypothetical protein